MPPAAHRLALGFGLAVGLALGWAYTRWIDPVEYTDASPAQLQSADQAEYALMVAQAYALDGDLARARGRLLGLGSDDPAGTLVALVTSGAASAAPPAELYSLASLAQALGSTSPALEPYLP